MLNYLCFFERYILYVSVYVPVCTVYFKITCQEVDLGTVDFGIPK